MSTPVRTPLTGLENYLRGPAGAAGTPGAAGNMASASLVITGQQLLDWYLAADPDNLKIVVPATVGKINIPLHYAYDWMPGAATYTGNGGTYDWFIGDDILTAIVLYNDYMDDMISNGVQGAMFYDFSGIYPAVDVALLANQPITIGNLEEPFESDGAADATLKITVFYAPLTLQV